MRRVVSVVSLLHVTVLVAAFKSHHPSGCSGWRRLVFLTPTDERQRRFRSVSMFQHKDDSVTPFSGAGVPRPELYPGEIPELLMDALQQNDVPYSDAGLESMWAFAGPITRHLFQNNMTDFVESAHDTADTMPTSFYGAAMQGKSWNMETQVNRVGGVDGYITTQVMKTVCSDGRVRRWQWELRKNRRPPNMDCWYVESIGSSNREGEFDAD